MTQNLVPQSTKEIPESGVDRADSPNDLFINSPLEIG
jgi:hypothetical protein